MIPVSNFCVHLSVMSTRLSFDNWISTLFIAFLTGVIVFCVVMCYYKAHPIIDKQYIITCEDSVEREDLLISIARLEGSVIVMQRMIPIYAGLVIAVILFLTWKQQNIAKSTAIQEINENFKKYKDRIESLVDKAEDLTAKIEIKHDTICKLTDSNFSLENLVSAIGQNKKT